MTKGLYAAQLAAGNIMHICFGGEANDDKQQIYEKVREEIRRAVARATGLPPPIGEGTGTPWIVYSCRSEYQRDAIRFFALLFETAAERELLRFEPYGEWEFATTLDRGGVLALLHRVPDSHVMRETLRACPLAENSLERTFLEEAEPGVEA